MHKGSKLSSKEQVQILTLDQVGKSSRKIAHIIKRSKNVILKFLKSPEKYKRKKRRKKIKITSQATRRLIRQASRRTVRRSTSKKSTNTSLNTSYLTSFEQFKILAVWHDKTCSVFRFGTAKLESRGVRIN